MAVDVKTVESASIGSYLMIGTTTGETTTWEKLCEIKNVPDLGGSPETIEITDLSDRYQRSVMGVQSNEAKEFTANYIPAAFQKIKNLEGAQHQFSVWLGDKFDTGTNTYTPTGSFGKFTWTGEISVFVASFDVNAVREMTITVTPATPITIEYGIDETA